MQIKFLLLAALYTLCSFGDKKQGKNLETKIIGTWFFAETRDANGQRLERYQESFGIVEATGPTLVYSKDHKFRKIFTPVNTDIGYWKLNIDEMIIEHQLYIDSTDWIGQDLIKRGLAIKAKDGNYYEQIDDKVLRLVEDTMFVDNRGRIDVFARKK